LPKSDLDNFEKNVHQNTLRKWLRRGEGWGEGGNEKDCEVKTIVRLVAYLFFFLKVGRGGGGGNNCYSRSFPPFYLASVHKK
jgi:hypothetical protein